MSANPYMPLYVADYLADTAHLTTLESGAYMLLIMHYWRRGGPLDNSNGRLANVARMSSDEWNRVEPVLAEFFQIAPDNVWHHKRIDAELQRASEKSRKAANAGRASAQRRLNGRSTDAQPEGNLSESESYKNKGVCESAGASEAETVTHTETEIRHRAFVISLPAIELAVLAAGLPKPEIKRRCLANALQWAAEIDAGKLPRDVLPQKIANFLRASIMGEVNRDVRPIHRTNARPVSPRADATRRAGDVLARMMAEAQAEAMQ